MPFPVCPSANQLASFAAGQTGSRRPNNYICTMPSPVRRAANKLASFAARPNRRQTAEPLHLYDAPLPSAVPPATSPVLPQSQTGSSRPSNYICTMHRSRLPRRKPPRQFCRKAKQEADGRAITSARCASHVCRRKPPRLFCRRRNRKQTVEQLHLDDAFSRLPRLLLCKLQCLKETLRIRQALLDTA